MRAIVIDDEMKARSLLTTILREYCPTVNEVFEAEDLPGGVAIIKEKHPDIVFLDIEMPGYLGVQILDFFDEHEINFHIVFTTAYNEYAIKAFQMNAVDYLLKPLRPNQIKESVAKVEKMVQQKNISAQLVELKEAMQNNKFGKIGLPVSDGIYFVRIEDIIYLKADGMYTHFYLLNDEKKVISKPMKMFVEILKGDPTFYRPHRSFLINVRFIKQLVKKDGPYIIMDNEGIVSISREKKDELITLLESL